MSEQPKTIGFEAVDLYRNPLAFVDYLNKVNSLETIRKYKGKAHVLLGVRDGDSILDVGCGIGIDTEEIAALFGPNIKIVGIDNSKVMIGIANSSLVGKDSSTLIEYVVQDAHFLGFGDNKFDISRADRTFQHLKDPAKALREMVRVTKPGGKILVIDTHWESLNIEGISREDAQTIRRAYEAIVLSPNIAIQLKDLMVKEGIKKTRIDFEKTQLAFPDLDSIEKVLWIDDSLSEAERVGAITKEQRSSCVNAIKKVSPDLIRATVDLYIAKGIKT